MVITRKNRRGIAAILLSITGLLGTQAGAAPLELTQQFPDIDVSSLAIAYDSNTGIFTAQTTNAQFEYNTDGSSPAYHYDWTYSLIAELSSGGTLTSGSLEILDGTDTMLSGNLNAFGYLNDPSGESDVFEFTFDVSQGTLAGDFGAQGGIIMVTNSSTFAGNFTNDFTATTLSSDTFAAVPVPAAAWLFGSGLLGLATVARRRGQV